MDSEQQAWDALRTISQAEAAARRQSQNNGTIPLVWSAAVFLMMAGYDLLPGFWALGPTFIGPLVASIWTIRYQRRLPVKPLKVEKHWLFGVWGFYHAAVLMGAIALDTHFWQAGFARNGTLTLAGLVDAAPLLWVGWQQRRACGGVS